MDFPLSMTLQTHPAHVHGCQQYNYHFIPITAALLLNFLQFPCSPDKWNILITQAGLSLYMLFSSLESPSYLFPPIKTFPIFPNPSQISCLFSQFLPSRGDWSLILKCPVPTECPLFSFTALTIHTPLWTIQYVSPV